MNLLRFLWFLLPKKDLTKTILHSAVSQENIQNIKIHHSVAPKEYITKCKETDFFKFKNIEII